MPNLEHNIKMKETQTTSDLVEYRFNETEKRFDKLESSLKELTDVILRLDKKLSSIPDSGLQCNVHILKNESMEKRLTALESKTEGLTLKIAKWSGGLAVIVLIIYHFIAPITVERLKTAIEVPSFDVPAMIAK